MHLTAKNTPLLLSHLQIPSASRCVPGPLQTQKPHARIYSKKRPCVSLCILQTVRAWLHFPSVLRAVDMSDFLEQDSVFHLFSNAFYNNSFVCMFRAYDAAWIRGRYCAFPRLAACAEIKHIIKPHTPDWHQVRLTIGPSGCNRIITSFLEPFDRPTPGQQTLSALFIDNIVAGHVRAGLRVSELCFLCGVGIPMTSFGTSY